MFPIFFLLASISCSKGYDYGLPEVLSISGTVISKESAAPVSDVRMALLYYKASDTDMKHPVIVDKVKSGIDGFYHFVCKEVVSPVYFVAVIDGSGKIMYPNPVNVSKDGQSYDKESGTYYVSDFNIFI